MRRLITKNNFSHIIALLSTVVLFIVPVIRTSYAQEGESLPPALELFQQGQEAEGRGDYAAATIHYIRALEQNENYFDPLLGLVRLSLFADDIARARQYLNRAVRYGRNLPELRIMEAQLATAEHDFVTADQIYRSILQSQPTNIEALRGSAELAVAQSDFARAIELYRNIETIDPRNRIALLALSFLYSMEEQHNFAIRYLGTALQYYPEHVQVLTAAARYYLERTQLDRAVQYAERAIARDAQSLEALQLGVEIAIAQEDYRGALQRVEAMLLIVRNDAHTWYLRGVLYDMLEEMEDSLHSFNQAIRLQGSNEIFRIALEEMVMRHYPLEDEVREAYSEYHIERGNDYLERNLIEYAQFEYRRGVQIAPYFRDIRLQFADVYLLQNLHAKYLRELEILSELGFTDTYILDRIEVYRSLLADSVGVQWDIEQFLLNRSLAAIDFYIDRRGSNVDTAFSLPYVQNYLRHILLFYENFELNGIDLVDSATDAFIQTNSRTAVSDYFVVMAIERQNRVLEVTAMLYSAQSDTILQEYRVVTQDGREDQLNHTLYTITAQIAADIPLKGRVVDRRGEDAVLVDLGRAHGIEVGDTLQVVHEGRVQVASDVIGYLYNEEDVRGTIEIVEADDLVSIGEFTRSTLFDGIGTNDHVLAAPSVETMPAIETESIPPAYYFLRTLR